MCHFHPLGGTTVVLAMASTRSNALALWLPLLLLYPYTVQAHGVMTTPISRSLRYATNAVDGFAFAGECPGGTACVWYNQKTKIPGQVTKYYTAS